MDNSYGMPGLLGRIFGGQAAPAAPGAPMDIRPQPLQQAMQPAQPAPVGSTYNPMADIGMRFMQAGQRMTPQERQQIVGSIPGAVAQNNYADQMRQQMISQMQPGPPAGLLGNGAPMTPAMAQGNNSVWANLGRGLNANGAPNANAGFPAAPQFAQHYAQPIAGSSPYGVY